MRLGVFAAAFLATLACHSQASPTADWLRQVANVPSKGTTEWSVVVTTGHFGRDPQLATSTKNAIVNLLAQVGAKGDRVKVYSAEMTVWASSRAVPIENIANSLPTSQAPGSKGGRDIEAVLLQVGGAAKGPVLVFSPGDSSLPKDGTGVLRGGDGSVAGFRAPLKRGFTVDTESRERTVRLTVLTKDGLFVGDQPRVSPQVSIASESTSASNSRKESQLNGQPGAVSSWPLWVGAALACGAAAGFLVGNRKSNRPPEPVATANPDDVSALEDWKTQAKQVQRRLDFVTQEIEESVGRMGQANESQLVELRQDLVRHQNTLQAWDQLAIDYLDGIERAVNHDQLSAEPSVTWVRARTQFLSLLARLGLDEIRPTPGDPVVVTLHRVEATIPPSDMFGTGEITRLLQPGYRRGDTVLRQAKVELAIESS